VWDDAPIPSRRLYPGKPTGSAMPLAWTHAEFVKLVLSSQVGTSSDCPRAVFARYGGRTPVPRTTVWSERAPVVDFVAGCDLRVNLQSASVVRWRVDRAGEWREIATQPGLPGVHCAVLPTRGLATASRVEFMWRRDAADSPSPTYEVCARNAD
jgi:glucoamylase